MNKPATLLGLDVGAARIGVARCSTMAQIPEPLEHIVVDGSEIDTIRSLVEEHQVDRLVVGLPRSLDGLETKQTEITRQFADKLTELGVPIAMQDEAVTSKKAEAELKARGKPYQKGDIDSLAAAYIVEDYIRESF